MMKISLDAHTLTSYLSRTFVWKWVLKLRKKKNITKQEIIIEEELPFDVEQVSEEHYLLEAGSKEWRLNDAHYTNPNSLLIYAIGCVNNIGIDDYDEVLLKSLNTRIRLDYLLDTFSEKDQVIEVQVQQLVQACSKQVSMIDKNLQVAYHLHRLSDNDLEQSFRRILEDLD